MRPDKGSAVMVSTRLPVDQCAVCTVSGVNDTLVTCHSSVLLVPGEEVKLQFTCLQPEQDYSVMINRTIGEFLLRDASSRVLCGSCDIKGHFIFQMYAFYTSSSSGGFKTIVMFT